MSRSNRAKVLVVGARPFDEAPFIERGLIPVRVELDQFDDALLSSARGIMLADHPGRFGLINQYFSGPFDRACEMGLMTASFSTGAHDGGRVAVARNAAYARIGAAPSKYPILWAVDETVAAISEKLARHDPGPELGKAKIQTAGLKIQADPAISKLLQRAFWDCDTITVEPLLGGKTAKGTYRVFASLAGPELGPQPMPFFVKIGNRQDIEDEKENYRRRAEPFIPFHLRPSLNEARCVSTLTSAALVCNFVDSAIALRETLRNGQGAGAIFSLFEVTLRGLRSHVLKSQAEPGIIETFFDKKVRVAEIPRARITRARRQSHCRDPKLLGQILKNLATGINSRRGIYHGDLHAGNVMVRQRDAIVIDFGSMQDFGPITADPAILEVSLVFGMDDGDGEESLVAWRGFVSEIFLKTFPLSPPPPSSDHFRFAWLRKAVREIRHVVTCCVKEDPEALIILCGCLLRFARLSRSDLKNKALRNLSEDRRSYALVIADRICSRIEKGEYAKS
ncbi:MAG: phosphotransferase [Pseudolabrys sp.]|nr:phosphotransferase [Pseudolabrys sp.]